MGSAMEFISILSINQRELRITRQDRAVTKGLMRLIQQTKQAHIWR